MVEAPKRATKFAANEQYTTIYKKLFGFEKITQTLSIMTGVSAGITEAVIIVPFELVKVRMQDKANVRKRKKKYRTGVNNHILCSWENTTERPTLLERSLLQKVHWPYSMV